MKKSLITIAALALASTAFASGNLGPATSSSVSNYGNINNTVSSGASTNGAGSSFSSAEGAAGASSSGYTSTAINPVCGGTCVAKSGEVTAGGKSATYNSGNAFNVSTDNGNGYASSNGSANAGADAKARYWAPGQDVTTQGSTYSQSQMGVYATKNTGGYANAGTKGQFDSAGNVGSKVCTGNGCGIKVTTEVWGGVSDTKSTSSYANSGALTVDSNLMNGAPANASANTVVNSSGSYHDPL